MTSVITAFRANLCKRKEAVGHLYTRSAIQHWLSAKIVSVTFSYLEPASGHFLTVASTPAGSIWPALACRQAGRPSQAKLGHPDRFPLLGPQVSPPQPKPPIHSGSQENCLHCPPRPLCLEKVPRYWTVGLKTIRPGAIDWPILCILRWRAPARTYVNAHSMSTSLCLVCTHNFSVQQV